MVSNDGTIPTPVPHPLETFESCRTAPPIVHPSCLRPLASPPSSSFFLLLSPPLFLCYPLKYHVCFHLQVSLEVPVRHGSEREYLVPHLPTSLPLPQKNSLPFLGRPSIAAQGQRNTWSGPEPAPIHHSWLVITPEIPPRRSFPLLEPPSTLFI
jgi:hypothetical protein